MNAAREAPTAGPITAPECFDSELGVEGWAIGVITGVEAGIGIKDDAIRVLAPPEFCVTTDVRTRILVLLEDSGLLVELGAVSEVDGDLVNDGFLDVLKVIRVCDVVREGEVDVTKLIG